MPQVTSLDRKNNEQNLTFGKINICLKKMIHKSVLKKMEEKAEYKIYANNQEKENVSEDRPIIYVCNSVDSHDPFVALSVIKDHTILFEGKQKLDKDTEKLFNLNGTIYVDRKNKEDLELSKEAMIETLKNKNNILVFPEETINLTDSNLLLEMNWRIIKVAQEAEALIVPLVLNYDYKNRTCEYRFGKPIDTRYISLITSINDVRDSMATIKWNFIELNKVTKRKDLKVEAERDKKMYAVNENFDLEYEKSTEFHRYPSNEEVFAPIKKLTR